MDKKLVGLITVFLLVFGVFMSYLLFGRNQQSLGIRANQSIMSCPNSFLFASDLNVPVGSALNLVAYIRNNESIGLAKIPVSCTTTLGSLNPADAVTGNLGNAIITLTSNEPGIATVTCSTASCGELANSVSVEFNQ